MKAIVGLGNLGDEYEGTRHNVGFEVVDDLARRWEATFTKWRSVAHRVVVKNHDAVLLKPRTYMNDSGRAIGAVMAFHKILPQDVLVIVDDVQLPLGKLRIRRSGSAGGHNGLKSVIQHIGEDFPRLRIGVDRGHPDGDLSDRVLSRFPLHERPIMDLAVTRAADAVETFLSDGLQMAMNRFNVSGDNLQSEI